MECYRNRFVLLILPPSHLLDVLKSIGFSRANPPITRKVDLGNPNEVVTLLDDVRYVFNCFLSYEKKKLSS